MRRAHLALLTVLALFAGCAGSPPPADWQMNAASALEGFEARWLEGNRRAAEASLARARAEIARSGRTELAARAELIACAARIASLDFGPCTAFTARAQDAHPDDLLYARFLTGDWAGLDASRLPKHYAPLLAARDAGARARALAEIDLPLPRLIAAAVLLQRGELSPEGMALATETAAERGWRRPLLAWLLLQRQRAETAGDREAVARLDRRIALVESGGRP